MFSHQWQESNTYNAIVVRKLVLLLQSNILVAEEDNASLQTVCQY